MWEEDRDGRGNALQRGLMKSREELKKELDKLKKPLENLKKEAEDLSRTEVVRLALDNVTLFQPPTKLVI